LAALFRGHGFQPSLAAFFAALAAHFGHNLRYERAAGLLDEGAPYCFLDYPQCILGYVALAIALWHDSIMPRIASGTRVPLKFKMHHYQNFASIYHRGTEAQKKN